MISINKVTGKRVNAFAEFTDADGTVHHQVPQHILQWVAEPALPADYSPETHDRIEVADAPYVVYQRKTDEQIANRRQEMLSAESLAYLAETDWMVLRAMEDSTKPVPAEVAAKRKAARDAVRRFSVP